MDRHEKQLLAAIEDRRSDIIEIGHNILKNPELGYAESKTATLAADTLRGLGLPVQTGLAVTGVKALLDTGRPGPTIAVIGELDAVVSHEHPFADPSSGAAHTCGHNAQMAAMLGVAMAFCDSGLAQRELSGRLCFLAAPAEEYGELEKRLSLRSSGKIRWLGGKQELLAAGALDDVDMAMMVHAATDGPLARVGLRAMGFIGKSIRFSGREAHAGGAPFDGVNALNAAMAAMMCIHANRETFRDEDGVRIHPIITRGGDLVNVVPSDVRMETYVRAWNLPAIRDAAEKTDRALQGGAYAIGARVDIADIPGYLPLRSYPLLDSLFAEAAGTLPELERVDMGGDFPGSTDMGDLSAVMPVLHPTIGGFTGAPHSKDFRAEDETLAYLTPAKAMALTAYRLLRDNAALGHAVKAAYPRRSYAEYAAMWDAILG